MAHFGVKYTEVNCAANELQCQVSSGANDTLLRSKYYIIKKEFLGHI
jgi:hypothetical protein